jgi:2'-5' RNA ligase
MQRLFVGLAVPELHRQRLALVRGPLPGAKWVEASDLHITLRYAGDIDNAMVREFDGFLAEIDAAPIEIRIGEIAAFGGSAPRTIHASVEATPELIALQRATEMAARSAGLAPEPQTFRPHVTLARLNGTRPDVAARFLGQRAGFRLDPFLVEEMNLYSSRPRVGGGPYVVETSYPLRW